MEGRKALISPPFSLRIGRKPASLRDSCVTRRFQLGGRCCQTESFRDQPAVRSAVRNDVANIKMRLPKL